VSTRQPALTRRLVGRVGAADDTGNAQVEFLLVAVVFIVPLVYLVVFLSQVQAAAFATEGAARDVVRAYTIADDDADAAARAAASVKVALEDHGLSPDRVTVDVDCEAPCVTPGREVAVNVRVRVPLPGVSSIGLDGMVVPVEASHRGVVDRLRAAP
jgi:Flp pilus assembly protein TadG